MGNTGTDEVEVIHSWSAPRSLSTSLMYSFAQRDDMEVLDEPLYAYFVHETGVERPYSEELLSKMETDGNKVVQNVIFGPGKKKYRYCKHMAKQRLPCLMKELLKKGKHFLLIRNPLDILPSFDKVVEPSFFELELASLVAIYCELSELGNTPAIVDAADLRKNPEGTLRLLCEVLGIPFQGAMLEWEAGPKLVDGLWAPWWYKTVHKSTGFKPLSEYPKSLDSKIHHNNLINNILAKVEGNLANAGDAIMLDHDGFVSETNATNLIVVIWCISNLFNVNKG